MRDPYQHNSRRKRKYILRRLLVVMLCLLIVAGAAFAVVKLVLPALNKAVAPEAPDDPDSAEAAMIADGLPPVLLSLQEVKALLYDYSQPVPESDAVRTGYLSDAVLIGHSRTQGLILYNGLTECINFALKGLSLVGCMGQEVTVPGIGTLPIPQALEQVDCQKVYLMFGMNDIGASLETFISRYTKVLDMVKAAQPDAITYVHAVLPITYGVERSRGSEGFTMKRVNEYNEALQALCAERKIYFLGVPDFLLTASGYLPDAAAPGDGIHLNSEYCKKWLSYLLTHTIQPDDYDGRWDTVVFRNEGGSDPQNVTSGSDNRNITAYNFAPSN